MLSLPFLTLTSRMHLPPVQTVLIIALDSYQEAALLCKAAIQQQRRAHPGFGARCGSSALPRRFSGWVRFQIR